jgi:hypothetical protein
LPGPGTKPPDSDDIDSGWEDEDDVDSGWEDEGVSASSETPAPASRELTAEEREARAAKRKARQRAKAAEKAERRKARETAAAAKQRKGTPKAPGAKRAAATERGAGHPAEGEGRREAAEPRTTPDAPAKAGAPATPVRQSRRSSVRLAVVLGLLLTAAGVVAFVLARR